MPQRLWDRWGFGKQEQFKCAPSCLPVRPAAKPLVYARRYGALSETPTPAVAAARAKTKRASDSATARAKTVAHAVAQRRAGKQQRRARAQRRRAAAQQEQAKTAAHFLAMKRAIDALSVAQHLIAVRTQRRHEAKHGLLPRAASAYGGSGSGGLSAFAGNAAGAQGGLTKHASAPRMKALALDGKQGGGSDGGDAAGGGGGKSQLGKLLQSKAKGVGKCATMLLLKQSSVNYTSAAAKALLPRAKAYNPRDAALGVKLLRSARLIQSAVRVQQAATRASATKLQATYRRKKARAALVDVVRRKTSAAGHWSSVKHTMKLIHGAHTGEDLVSGSTPVASRRGSKATVGGRDGAVRGGVGAPSATVRITAAARKLAKTMAAADPAHAAVVAAAEQGATSVGAGEQCWAGNYRVGGRLVHISVWHQQGGQHGGLPTLDVRMMYYLSRKVFKLVLGPRDWASKGFGPLGTLSERRINELGEQICLDLQDSDFDPTITRRVPLFSSLSDAVHDEILKRVSKKNEPPNTTVCVQGTMGDYMYFVKKGEVRRRCGYAATCSLLPASLTLPNRPNPSLFRPPPPAQLNVIVDGVVVGQMGADAFFGEMALMSVDGKRTSTVLTTSPCELFRLSRRDFKDIVKSEPMLLAEIKSTQHFVVHNTGPEIGDGGDGAQQEQEGGNSSADEVAGAAESPPRRNSIVMDALNRAMEEGGVVMFEGIAPQPSAAASVEANKLLLAGHGEAKKPLLALQKSIDTRNVQEYHRRKSQDVIAARMPVAAHDSGTQAVGEKDDAFESESESDAYSSDSA
jgi:CRP-like cAMP-binding protein